jgi:hypothetical protein
VVEVRWEEVASRSVPEGGEVDDGEGERVEDGERGRGMSEMETEDGR